MILGDGTLAEAIAFHLPDGPSRLIWCAYDTPIRDDGSPDTESVLDRLRGALEWVAAGQLVVICSQLPIGTCAALEVEFPQHEFVVYPENVRAAHAVEDFASQDRVVLGARTRIHAEQIALMLEPFSSQFFITTPETAEMVKHALNGFLAVSICYAQEIARLATKHGADPDVLAEALLTDHRIGPSAYLRPAGELGPHLGREVHNLLALGGGPLIQALA